MAALYLHNALFIPEPQDHQQQPQRGSVHARTISTGTLRTVATNASHPTEPLLTPESPTYPDILIQQPPYQSSIISWQNPLSFEGEPTTFGERKGFWEKRVKRRLRVLKCVKITIESIMAIWSIYNTVRYFLAFTIYEVMDGQSVSIVLGSSTALGFALYACAGILVASHAYLVAHYTPIRSLIAARTIFRTIGSFLLLVPAIVNFVLVFFWKNTTIPQISVAARCHLDIDVIWSVTTNGCENGPSWTAWLVMSICRLVFTLVFLALQYISASAYHATRRPSLSRQRHQAKHHRFDSDGASTLAPPPMSNRSSAFPVTSSSATVIPFPSSTHLSRPHSLHSKGHTPDRRSLKSLHSKSRPGSSGSAGHSPTSAPNSPRGSRVIEEEPEVDDEVGSDESHSTEAGPSSSGHHHHYLDLPVASSSAASTSSHHHPSAASSSLGLGLNTNPISSLEEERELHRFANQFRSLVSQITREVEDAIEFSVGQVPIPSAYLQRTESPLSMTDEDSTEASSSEYGNDNYTRLPGYNRTHISYNEFGIPYATQAFDRVRIVNGYVRRMPTIESLGSREVQGSVASSSQASPIIDNGGHDRIPSIHSLSRPPTRTNTMDTASDPPTRANSLKERRNGRVSQLLETTELGELISERIQREQQSCSSRATSSSGSGTSYSSASGGMEESVHSYHTASSDNVTPRSAVSGYGQDFILRNLDEADENAGIADGHDENTALVDCEDTEASQRADNMSSCHLA